MRSAECMLNVYYYTLAVETAMWLLLTKTCTVAAHKYEFRMFLLGHVEMTFTLYGEAPEAEFQI